MRALPSNGRIDSVWALRRRPFSFIGDECRRLQSDVFAARLALMPVICMSGAEAGALLCDPARFVRHRAAPAPMRNVFFGRGTVQGLDSDAHRGRKALFVDVLRPEHVAQLQSAVGSEWLAAARRWAERGTEVVLYDAMRTVLARAVCAWAGVPVADQDAEATGRQLASLFETAAALGPRRLRGLAARRSLETRLAQCIVESRRGSGARSTLLDRVADHRDADGAALSPTVAAAELLNVLRPTVAVAVWIVFVAHALETQRAARAKLLDGTLPPRAFVEEVRRCYPFFPFVAARVRSGFEWRGLSFPAGRRVLFDLFGTNHDPRVWDDPWTFLPARFVGRRADPFGFVPQGPGDVARDHRCPGEGVAVALMELAVTILTRHLDYIVPAQDLRIDEATLPPLPADRLRIRPLAWREP
jgi:fatty-acid peroxygenase